MQKGCIGGTNLVPLACIPALAPTTSPAPLTGAAELVLLDLSHVEAAKLGRSSTLGEEPDGGALAQPLRQPGQVAVAEEMVGMQAAAGGWSSQQLQDSSCPPHCPPAAPAWLIPKSGGIQREIQRGLRASVPVAKATMLGMLCRGVPTIPSPWCCPSTTEPPAPAAELGTSHSSPGGDSHHHHDPDTHNVRSLGMWLKLDTGIEVILLLFRVLQEDKEGQVRADRL